MNITRRLFTFGLAAFAGRASMAMTIVDIKANYDKQGYLTDDDEYNLLLLKNDPPNYVVFPDDAVIESYRGRLPDFLLRLWKEQGWGAWSEGRYWLCDPAFLQPVLEEVFKGDPEYDAADMTAIGYSAFGAIDIYLGNFDYIYLDLATSYASTRNSYLEERAGGIPSTENYAVITLLQTRVYRGFVEINEVLEVGKTDMFPLAVEKFGLLEPVEIYGFAPPYSVTHTHEFKHLQKMKLREHLIFLNELERPTLHKYSASEDISGGGFGSIEAERKIGPQ